MSWYRTGEPDLDVLDLGIVRDSSLDVRNDIHVFAETFYGQRCISAAEWRRAHGFAASDLPNLGIVRLEARRLQRTPRRQARRRRRLVNARWHG